MLRLLVCHGGSCHRPFKKPKRLTRSVFQSADFFSGLKYVSQTIWCYLSLSPPLTRGRFFSLIYSARKAYKPQIVFWKKTSGLDFGFLCKFSLNEKFYPAQIFSWNREHSVRPRCAKCVYHFLHFLSDAVHQIFFCQNDQLTCWLVLVINFLMTEAPASQIIC